jgi:addiction module RelE/StbE family toxin
MKVKLSSRFKKSFRKLHPRIQEKAVGKMRIFEESKSFDSRLEIHKLHGKQKDEWAYSIDRSYRISFIFLNENNVLYLNVGTHDELYK